MRATLLRVAGIALAAALALPFLAGTAAASPHPVGTRSLDITTVPPMPLAVFLLDGIQLPTDARGVAHAIVPKSAQLHRITLLDPLIRTNGTTAEFVRWHGQDDVDQGYTPQLDDVALDRSLALRASFRVSKDLRFAFVDQAHDPVDPARVTAMTVRNETGRILPVSPTGTTSLVSTRTSIEDEELITHDASYTVQSVTIDGTNVVNVGEQRFRPSQVDGTLDVVVLLRSAHLRVTDRLLGTPIATTVALTYPDGRVLQRATDGGGELVLDNLARGTYQVSVPGQALPVVQDLLLSRSQFVDLAVLTPVDAVLAGAVALLALAGLLAAGRWRSNQLRAARAAATRADELHAMTAPVEDEPGTAVQPPARTNGHPVLAGDRR